MGDEARSDVMPPPLATKPLLDAEHDGFPRPLWGEDRTPLAAGFVGSVLELAARPVGDQVARVAVAGLGDQALEQWHGFRRDRQNGVLVVFDVLGVQPDRTTF